ncbi:MAG: EamA family transporter, partial [Lachnospiraceae bacterium]|nr:EamA family transporter [Lachnospiraceae bacterium]
MKKPLYTILLPLLAALIWGTAFSMQRIVVAHLSPFSFNGIRFTMGALLLLVINLVRAKHFGLRVTNWKKLLLGSLCCGLALAAASDVQQFGVMHAAAGKAG